jgi:hypothetical protein
MFRGQIWRWVWKEEQGMEPNVDVQGKGREGTADQTWWTLLMMLVLMELLNCAVHPR